MTEDFIQENEDRELFRRIKQGSEEAFREVYGKYHRILYAVALKMLKDRSAAENAVQHVFVKLWIGRQEMTVMLSLRNYLYTMTRNYILNYLRSRNTELVHSYRLAQLVPEASDPLDAQIEREDPRSGRSCTCARRAIRTPRSPKCSIFRSTPSVRTTRRASNS